jgi:hypothetical protein
VGRTQWLIVHFAYLDDSAGIPEQKVLLEPFGLTFRSGDGDLVLVASVYLNDLCERSGGLDRLWSRPATSCVE